MPLTPSTSSTSWFSRSSLASPTLICGNFPFPSRAGCSVWPLVLSPQASPRTTSLSVLCCNGWGNASLQGQKEGGRHERGFKGDTEDRSAPLAWIAGGALLSSALFVSRGSLQTG